MATKRAKPVHQLTSAQFDALFPEGDEDACKAYLKARRWPNGVHCPRCGNVKVYELKARLALAMRSLRQGRLSVLDHCRHDF